MNIYEKLQECKSELQSMKLPKTGKNKFAGYEYWELSDFLPTVVSLFKQHSICSFVSFSPDVATLTVVNTEKPEEFISVTSPMATADLKGCHAIQNMGAVETYQRRYLYQSLLDISEPDALDGTMKPDPQKQDPPHAPKPTGKITKAQAEQIWSAIKAKFGANAHDMLLPLLGTEKLAELPAAQFADKLHVIEAYQP